MAATRWSTAAEWLAVIAIATGLKLALLALDPTVRTFMGDSGSYLHYAVVDTPPPDRSFTYPLLLQATALAAGSMKALLLVQALFGIASAAVVFALLRHVFRCAFPLAATLACLLAIEPAQLFYERMVMAESAGTCAFLATLGCGFGYVHTRRVVWLLCAAALAAVTVSLRLSLLPVVLGLAPLPPLVVAFAGNGAPFARRMLAGFALAALAIVATLAFQGLYKRWYDALSHHDERVDYIHASGFMRIGLVAPLIRPEHLDGLGLPTGLLDEVRLPLGDRHLREAQVWSPGGLVDVLRRHAGEGANRAARKITMRAFRDDPLGIVRLGLATMGDYFEDGIARWRLDDDRGIRPPDDGLVALMREKLGYDAAGVATRESPVERAFAHSRWWLTGCLFALPLLALLLLVANRGPTRAPALLLACALGGCFAAQLLFSHIVSFRYLHPLPPLVLLAVGAIAQGARDARTHRRAELAVAALR